jgi:cytochrome P450
MALCIIVGYLFASNAIAIVHRLYFNPLAPIPGPKIAAATRLYELWYQGVHHTQFPHKIKQLHKQYGPIVRISPFEISLNDSKFNINFFMSDTKLDKDPWYYFFGFTNALFVLTNKAKHKERQTNLANHFRGKYWTDSFPMITREISSLVGKFESAAQHRGELNLSKVFRKTGNEVLRNFLLGEDYDGENADSRDFAPQADTFYHPLFRAAAWIRHFPWMFKIHNMTPDWMFEAIMPMAKYKREIESMIRTLIRDHDANGKPARNKSLFYQIIDHDPSYRDHGGISAIEEYMELLWGGREVLGHALCNIAYHLMDNPRCMTKLHDELKTAPIQLENATYAQLQKLPYLWAICKEGMRMQLGGTFRIPRVVTEDVQYGDYLLPAGTAVSMSPNFFHDDPEIFPDPMTFRPERWLEADSSELTHMEKFWNPFGNGSRSCGGRPMAYEVVFRGIANVFSRYKINWHGCDADYCLKEGMMEVFPPGDSTGLRVSVARWDDTTVN